MTTTENTVKQFGDWLVEFVDEAGDAPSALERLKILKTLRGDIGIAIKDLEAIIAEDVLPEGQKSVTAETPHGAVLVRDVPGSYVYPSAKSDEFKDLFRHVVARLADKIDHDAGRPELQMAEWLWEIWNMGAANVRSTKLKELTGLWIGDYRDRNDNKKTVQIL